MRAPENFYVDNALYAKDAAYGAFCEDQIVTLNQLRPRHLSHVIDFLTTKIEGYYKAQQKTFGSYRELETDEHGRTSDQHQHDVIKKTLLRMFGSEDKIRDYTISCVLPGDADSSVPSRNVPLTSIVKEPDGRYGIRHFTSPDEQDSYNAELLWSECSKQFQRAITPLRPGNNAAEHTTARRTAALELYWNLSHYMPYKRGSATAARIVLEHLADSIGFSTGKPKPDVDINIEALLRDKQDFVNNFEQFFESSPEKSSASPAAPTTSHQR